MTAVLPTARRSIRRRRLSVTETAYAREVFRDSVDLSRITLTKDSLISIGAPKTLGNTIHLRTTWAGHRIFDGDRMELTDRGLQLLVHEIGHVWQYQNGGLIYIPRSLWSQLKGAIRAGDRNAAYDWRAVHRAGRPWAGWNPEQQAKAIEDYNRLLRLSLDPASAAEPAELAILRPYLQQVWARRGAPRFGRHHQEATPR